MIHKEQDEFYERLFKTWYSLLKPLLNNDKFNKLLMKKKREYLIGKDKVFPPQKEVFKAFQLTNYNELKVIIIGKEPYKNGTANGLAYGINDNSLLIPNELIKIFMTIESDYYDGLLLNQDWSLENYARQGVLLLNMALTIGEKKSHKEDWASFMKKILYMISKYRKKLVFIVLDHDLIPYTKWINKKNGHFIIISEDIKKPLSMEKEWNFSIKGVNEFLKANNRKEINW